MDSVITEKRTPTKSLFCSGKNIEKQKNMQKSELLMQSPNKNLKPEYMQLHSLNLPQNSNKKPEMKTKTTSIHYHNFLKEQEMDISTIPCFKENEFDSLRLSKQNLAKKPNLQKGNIS